MQVNRGTAAAPTWVANDKLWIITACSFLKGDAADWAASIVEGIETLMLLFADYPAFITAFRTRFETVDEAGDVLTALKCHRDNGSTCTQDRNKKLKVRGWR